MYVKADPFQKNSQTGAIIKVLAEEKLEEFADRVQTRILEGKPAGVKGSRAGMQQDKYNDILQNHAETFQAFLNYSGLADNFDVQQLAVKGNEGHVKHNTKILASDAQLKKEAKKMGAFVDMLSEDMPYECALVTHFDWVAKNLFSL
ncbi:TPA: hypothetical protein ACH3X3_014258 [Trebouxia sp. C0006]